MEFGIFVQGHVPRRKVAEDPGYEHTSFLHDVELVKQADRLSCSYVGSSRGCTVPENVVSDPAKLSIAVYNSAGCPRRVS